MLGDESIRDNDGASGVAVDHEFALPHRDLAEDRVAGVQGHGHARGGYQSRPDVPASVDELDGDASVCGPCSFEPVDRENVGDQRHALSSSMSVRVWVMR